MQSYLLFSPKPEQTMTLHSSVIQGKPATLIKVLDEITKLTELKMGDASGEFKARDLLKRYLNKKNKRGNLALHEGMKMLAGFQSRDLASLENLSTVITILLAHGADPTMLNEAAQTALDCAIDTLPDAMSKVMFQSEVKEVTEFTEKALANLCVRLSTVPGEDLFMSTLLKVINAGADVDVQHIQKLQKKGYFYFSEILLEKLKPAENESPPVMIRTPSSRR